MKWGTSGLVLGSDWEKPGRESECVPTGCQARLLLLHGALGTLRALGHDKC